MASSICLTEALATASCSRPRVVSSVGSTRPEGAPVAFAIRATLPDVDLDAVAQPGIGIALWLHATNAQELHDALASSDVPITAALIDGPFGRTFTFADPDGYLVTIHDRA